MSEEPRRRPDDEDIDARFAEIVAGLGLSAEPDEPDAAPDADPEDDLDEHESEDQPPPAAGPAPSPPAGPPPAAPAGQPGTGWREWSGPEEDEHFIPPDPPPLPAGDLHFWGILVGLLGGPLILFLAHGLGLPVLRDPLWTWLGLGLSLGGFALLVLRLPTRRDDDPSGGARV